MVQGRSSFFFYYHRPNTSELQDLQSEVRKSGFASSFKPEDNIA